MEVIIQVNGQPVAVEVTVEVYEYLIQAEHKNKNWLHEQRRHWDGRGFDEYIAFTEGRSYFLSRRNNGSAGRKRCRKSTQR